MRKKKDGIIIYVDKGNKRGRNPIMLVFLAFLIIIAIYIPIFGSSLRFQTSQVFQNIFEIIGSLSKLIGILMAGYGFLSIFTNRRVNIGALLIGGLMLWIGCFLTYTPFTLFGMTLGGGQPPVGYH